MPSITRNFTVPEKGIGRKDYSQNVEEAVVPIARSHQYRVYSTLEYDLSAYSFATIDAELIYGTIAFVSPSYEPRDYMLYYVDVAFDSNVLIKSYFSLYNSNTGEFTRYQLKYGYGKVGFFFPKGWLTSKEQGYDEGLWPAIEFLPGGYVIRETFSFLSDELVRAD